MGTLREGRSLTSDERAQLMIQGTAMHIGSTVAHKVADDVIVGLASMGARASATIRKAKRLKRVGAEVAKTGDLDKTLALIGLANDVVNDEIAFLEARAAESPHRTKPEEAADNIHIDKASKLREEYGELAVDSISQKTDLPPVRPKFLDMAIDAIIRQGGLEPSGPNTFAGEPARVRDLVAKAKRAGITTSERTNANGHTVVTMRGDERSIDIGLFHDRRADDPAVLIARIEADVATGKPTTLADRIQLARLIADGRVARDDLRPEVRDLAADHVGVNLHDHILGVPVPEYFYKKIHDDPVLALEAFLHHVETARDHEGKADVKIEHDRDAPNAMAALRGGVETAKAARAAGDDAKAIELAHNAWVEALGANVKVHFDETYTPRDEVIKKFTGDQYRELTTDAIKIMAEQGMAYSEQSASLNKMEKRFTPQTLAEGRLAAGDADRDVDIRYLAMLDTKLFADEDAKSPRFEEDIKRLKELLTRDEVLGADVAAPEKAEFSKAGQERLRRLFRAVEGAADLRGRPMVFRPHVGEGYNESDGGNSDHADVARKNLSAVLEVLQDYNRSTSNVIVRFGHATHASDAQLKVIAEKGIIVESNIGSNLATGSIEKVEQHPLLKMLYLGVDTVLATDGGGVTGTNLKNEYDTASDLITRFRSGAEDAPRLVIDGKEIRYGDLTPAEQNRFSLERLQKTAADYLDRVGGKEASPP